MVRKGRAHYVCKECGDDVSLELVFLADCDSAIVDKIKVHKDTK